MTDDIDVTTPESCASEDTVAVLESLEQTAAKLSLASQLRWSSLPRGASHCAATQFKGSVHIGSNVTWRHVTTAAHVPRFILNATWCRRKHPPGDTPCNPLDSVFTWSCDCSREADRLLRRGHILPQTSVIRNHQGSGRRVERVGTRGEVIQHFHRAASCAVAIVTLEQNLCHCPPKACQHGGPHHHQKSHLHRPRPISCPPLLFCLVSKHIKVLQILLRGITER